MNDTIVAQLARMDMERIKGYKVYLEDVAVARNLPSAEMIAGRNVAVMLFDENNPKEAVIAAVYT